MADIVMNQGLGAARYYAGLPAANDALVLVLLRSTSIEADATLRDYATLSALLAGTSDECTAPNYTRKLITSGTTVTYDAATNRVDCFFPAQTITSLGSIGTLQQVSKLLVCYWPINGTGGDAAILPLTMHDYVHACDGTDFQLNLPNGFYRDAS